MNLTPANHFDVNPEFERDEWWQRGTSPVDDDIARRLSAVSDGVEVARVEIGKKTGAWPHKGAPDLDEALQIVFIEVAQSLRKQGIGRRIVDLLADKHSDCRLYALSRTDAEGFWSKIGWERYEPTIRMRALYLQPEGKGS